MLNFVLMRSAFCRGVAWLKARRLLSMVATARMMRLYACVRYWPYRGVRKFASVLKLILYKR